MIFLFPGQGAQFVGMGRDLAATFPVANRVFEEAEDVLGMPLRKICWQGPDRLLRDSANAQPAIFTHSVAALSVLWDAGIDPRITVGHSAGQLAALHCAGALSFSTALRLVRERGLLMGGGGPSEPGQMVAVVGLPAEQVRQACAAVASFGRAVLANDNAPRTAVISGDPVAVTRAATLCEEWGASRRVPLQVSGAFHSPLMTPAEERFRELVATVEVRDPKITVYGNVSARPLTTSRDVKTELEQQITRPVRWREIMGAILESGHEMLVEVGPGKTLKGLLLRTDSGRNVHLAGTVTDLKRALQACTERQAVAC